MKLSRGGAAEVPLWCAALLSASALLGLICSETEAAQKIIYPPLEFFSSLVFSDCTKSWNRCCMSDKSPFCTILRCALPQGASAISSKSKAHNHRDGQDPAVTVL